MLSPKFERVKERYPGLSGLLDSLGEYIELQAKSNQQYVIPKLAAAALHLNDGEAFVLLEMLSEGGVLQRIYNVYCRKNNALLATVDSLEKANEVSQCDFCDREHDTSDLNVELAFRLPAENLSKWAA